MAEMIRVNTRISTDLNNWLDKESSDSGLPKSTLIMLALEDYRKQKQAMDTLKDVNPILAKLEQLERRLSKGESEET